MSVHLIVLIRVEWKTNLIRPKRKQGERRRKETGIEEKLDEIFHFGAIKTT